LRAFLQNEANIGVTSLHYPGLLQFRAVATLLCLGLLAPLVAAPAAAPADEVDPFLGTLGGGNVFPGPSLPFGYLQPGPDTGPGSNAGGYKFNKPINGFSQQHISGMGGPTLGQFSLMPATGEVADPSDIVSTGKSAEAASPGYYTVTLAPWNVKVELTVAQRVARGAHGLAQALL
jgi:putative alpha-1,2-mannosidase